MILIYYFDLYFHRSSYTWYSYYPDLDDFQIISSNFATTDKGNYFADEIKFEDISSGNILYIHQQNSNLLVHACSFCRCFFDSNSQSGNVGNCIDFNGNNSIQKYIFNYNNPKMQHCEIINQNKDCILESSISKSDDIYNNIKHSNGEIKLSGLNISNSDSTAYGFYYGLQSIKTNIILNIIFNVTFQHWCIALNSESSIDRNIFKLNKNSSEVESSLIYLEGRTNIAKCILTRNTAQYMINIIYPHKGFVSGSIKDIDNLYLKFAIESEGSNSFDTNILTKGEFNLNPMISMLESYELKQNSNAKINNANVDLRFAQVRRR